MQFTALRDRVEAQDWPRGKVLELLLAQLTATVANYSLRELKKPLTPQDFMVTTRQPEAARAEPKRRMTKKLRSEIASNWKMGFATMLRNQKLKKHR